MKSGFKTTEFWLTLVAQLISLLVMTGAIPQADTGMLNESASKIAAGVVAALTLCKYIHSRTLVKTSVWLLILLVPGLAKAQDNLVSGGVVSGRVVASGQMVCGAGKRPPLTTHYSPLTIQKTCLFGNCGGNQSNAQVIQLLTQIVNQNAQLIALLQAQQRPQQPPAAAPAPQLIVLGGPLQQIPLGGAPPQQIPLGGPPLQNIPLGGPPQQNIPLGPAPQQNIPLGTPPQQNIPLGPPPASPPMPRVPQTGPTGYQRFTIAQTYWRPAVSHGTR
ncbi:MAG TPA: hypothetical protein VG099_08580 [Gemmataceae bacterium]|jgi:hypothetical protein|nr:hypothetical protein [Gemmataceae bacterium]